MSTVHRVSSYSKAPEILQTLLPSKLGKDNKTRREPGADLGLGLQHLPEQLLALEKKAGLYSGALFLPSHPGWVALSVQNSDPRAARSPGQEWASPLALTRPPCSLPGGRFGPGDRAPGAREPFTFGAAQRVLQ